MTKPKYVVTNVLTLHLAQDLSFKRSVKPRVLTLSIFSTKSAKLDKVTSMEIHPLPEVLDPEQNWSFNDHYINVPLDLSQVSFICTASSLDSISSPSLDPISSPSLDQCEIVHPAGYTFDEKVAIANRFLVPKQIGMNELNK